MQHQQEQSVDQGYTHKKFNCSYSHKKLGMRLRKREGSNKENIDDHQQVAKKQRLFRPYALGNDTPRKRKNSGSSSESSDDDNSQTLFTYSPQSSPVTTTGNTNSTQAQTSIINSQTCLSSALSPNSYAERLQRQRAVLYMRYMQQFHSGNMAAALQGTNASGVYYPMGYPNVTAPIYNGC